MSVADGLSLVFDSVFDVLMDNRGSQQSIVIWCFTGQPWLTTNHCYWLQKEELAGLLLDYLAITENAYEKSMSRVVGIYWRCHAIFLGGMPEDFRGPWKR